MAWNARILKARPVAFFHYCIAVADAAGFDFDAHLSSGGLRDRALDYFKDSSRFAYLHGLHAKHSSVLYGRYRGWVLSHDILRDEGEQYAKKLMQAGVEVTPIRVLATHHDYALLNALADTPATKATVQIVSEKLSSSYSPFLFRPSNQTYSD